MKFGQKITTDLYGEWKPYYLDYILLKRHLKDHTTGQQWTPRDETEFTALLEAQLDKVHDFQKTKTSQLSREIRDTEKAVKVLVAQADALAEEEEIASPAAEEEPNDPESLETDGYGHDPGSDDEAGDSDDDVENESVIDDFEEQFRNFEQIVANLVAEIHDITLYTKLNITGFMKILKKHDKQTGLGLKATFIPEYLEKRPFYKYNWDALIVKLSHLYDLVRTRGHPVQGDSSAGGSQSAFVRQTTKYWVHPDNLVALKLSILRNLPVLGRPFPLALDGNVLIMLEVFNPQKDFDQKDSAITSIYFDNEDLELYLGRLEKTEGAEAVRLRWYGDVNTQTIFVERKTHREDWTGEKSVKARFPLKEHQINPFLRGEYTVDEDFQKLVQRGKKSQQEVDSMIQLANEVQYAVLTRNLKPVMRTFYNRTAFQLPGDARVRISLDTELTLVREDNWDGQVRAGDNWRRTDIGVDHPFPQLDPADKEPFKYGVLEIKLQTQFGQEPPEWVTSLVQSHLVEAVPKFSKFIHGCATLMPHRVDLVPFWLPQMDTDILKPDRTGYMQVIERPVSHTPSPITSKESSTRQSSEGTRSPHDELNETYYEPESEGEDDDRNQRLALDEDKRTGLTGEEVREAIAFREERLKERREDEARDRITGISQSFTQKLDNQHFSEEVEEEEEEEEEEGDDQDDSDLVEDARLLQRRPSEPTKPRALSIDPLAPSARFDQTLKHRLHAARREREQDENEEGEDEELDNRVLSSGLFDPAGRRISVPVRIEPKVYFACERTFLKWLNTAVLLGTIATTLLNFTDADDYSGMISATLFTLTALLAIAYSAGIFIYRTLRLRKRRAHGLYYDKVGPTALSLVLFTALATNLGLRLAEMD